MIYFIQDSRSGDIKIGYSREDARLRLRSLQCGNPAELHLLGTCEGLISDERALHSQFSDYRLRGEWFIDCPQIRVHIAEYCDTANSTATCRAAEERHHAIRVAQALQFVDDRRHVDQQRHEPPPPYPPSEFLYAPCTVRVGFPGGSVTRKVDSREEAAVMRLYLEEARVRGFHYSDVQKSTLCGCIPNPYRILRGLPPARSGEELGDFGHYLFEDDGLPPKVSEESSSVAARGLTPGGLGGTIGRL